MYIRIYPALSWFRNKDILLRIKQKIKHLNIVITAQASRREDSSCRNFLHKEKQHADYWRGFCNEFIMLI